jgi:hypothetical protein
MEEKSVMGSITKPDISALVRIGHFCFGLTVMSFHLDYYSRLRDNQRHLQSLDKFSARITKSLSDKTTRNSVNHWDAKVAK